MTAGLGLGTCAWLRGRRDDFKRVAATLLLQLILLQTLTQTLPQPYLARGPRLRVAGPVHQGTAPTTSRSQGLARQGCGAGLAADAAAAGLLRAEARRTGMTSAAVLQEALLLRSSERGVAAGAGSHIARCCLQGNAIERHLAYGYLHLFNSVQIYGFLSGRIFQQSGVNQLCSSISIISILQWDLMIHKRTV